MQPTQKHASCQFGDADSKFCLVFFVTQYGARLVIIYKQPF